MRTRISFILGFLMLLFLLSCEKQKLSEEQQHVLNEQLNEAVRNEDIRSSARLLRKGADPNSLYDEGTSVLHMAIYKNNPEIVDLLIDKGADVMFPADNQVDPLFIAVQAQQTDVIESLVEAGADINHINNDRVKSTALMQAAFLNDVDLCRYFVENGAELDLVSYYKFPAVGWASQNKALEATRYLVEAGADISLVVNYYGQFMTLLDVAIMQGDAEIEQYLRSAGAVTLYYEAK